MSMTSGTVAELMSPSGTGADFTALASFTSEASLLGGLNLQPTVPGNYFDKPGKVVEFRASGVLSSTGTPTYTFFVRASSTQGSSTLSGAILGQSVAITTGSGVSTQLWDLWLRVVCKTLGQGSGNTTLVCWGLVSSPGGFASPFAYALEPTTPPTATWTQTADGAVNNYLNLSVSCSASSASNTITCKWMGLTGWN